MYLWVMDLTSKRQGYRATRVTAVFGCPSRGNHEPSNLNNFHSADLDTNLFYMLTKRKPMLFPIYFHYLLQFFTSKAPGKSPTILPNIRPTSSPKPSKRPPESQSNPGGEDFVQHRYTHYLSMLRTMFFGYSSLWFVWPFYILLKRIFKGCLKEFLYLLKAFLGWNNPIVELTIP